MFIEIVAIEQNKNQFIINLDEICLIKCPDDPRRVNEKSTRTGKGFYHVVDMEIVFKNGKTEKITIDYMEFQEFLVRLKQQKDMIGYNEIVDACQATRKEIERIRASMYDET